MNEIQQIGLSKKEADQLIELYKNHKEYQIRHRAHIILLRNSGFTVPAIRNTLWLDENYISLYIKAWYYFRIEGLLSNETEDLLKRIREIESPEPIEIKPWIDWGKLLESIKMNVRRIYSFSERIIFAFVTFLLKAFLWIFTNLKGIDYKKFYSPFNQSVSNKLNVNIDRDSNNNVVFQIVNVVNGQKESDLESKITSTLQETKMQFLEIFQKEKDYLSNSQTIALFLALNDQIQQIKDAEKRKRFLTILATSAAMFVFFNTAIKGGLVIITFLGISITLFNLNTCNSPNNSLEKNFITAQSDSLRQAQNRKKFVLDSLDKEEVLKKRLDSLAREQEIADSLSQIALIEEDDDCYYFAKNNNYVSRLIKEDRKDYRLESYFVSTDGYNDKFFIIVRVFDDIKEAAFQRKQIIDHGYNNSKIVEIMLNGKTKYALSIEEFSSTSYDEAITQLLNWEESCNVDKYKPMIFHNGL